MESLIVAMQALTYPGGTVLIACPNEKVVERMRALVDRLAEQYGIDASHVSVAAPKPQQSHVQIVVDEPSTEL